MSSHKEQSTFPPSPRHVPIWIAYLLLLCFSNCFCAISQTPTASALSLPLIIPSAVVFDSTGNFYFAETGNHVIRKVDMSGNISTVAGTGEEGFSGDAGPATAATLDSPQGLALDTANNLYIGDTRNHRIRKVDLANGTISTIAGGRSGFSGDNEPAIGAQLFLPAALAVDVAGNLYLADTGNHRIRKIAASTGVITTIAGTGTQGYSGDNGPATSAAIDSPSGIALDAANNLYLSDTHNHRIRKITTNNGIITTIAGSGLPGFSGDTSTASAAALFLPHGLTVDSTGNLYLADTANHRIRRIDVATGIITTIAGDGTQAYAGDNGSAVAASLDSPTSTALSPVNLLTLSDSGNQRIRQLTAQPAPDTVITTIAGLDLSTPGTLTLAAPSVITYGIGQLTASLASSPATGSVTFFEVGNATNATIGSSALISNSATLSTARLPAGPHQLFATYSGDQTHSFSKSPILALNITPAPTNSTLVANSTGSPSAMLNLHVDSATTGTPSGSATFLDGNIPLFTTSLSALGDANFTANSLAQGSHTFTAVYNGSSNFSPSTSNPQLIAVGTTATPDFTLSVTGATIQTIVSGSTATFTFASQMLGNLSSPITLAATGLPNLATASFNPAYLPPGTGTASFSLSIATPKATALKDNSDRRLRPLLAGTFFLCPIIVLAVRKANATSKLYVVGSLSLTMIFVAGCGDRVNSSALTSGSAKSYTSLLRELLQLQTEAASSTARPLPSYFSLRAEDRNPQLLRRA